MGATFKLKLTQADNSVGLVLPADALAHMNLADGDEIYLIELPEGYRLTACSPEFEEQMATAGQVMKKRRNALRGLAK